MVNENSRLNLEPLLLPELPGYLPLAWGWWVVILLVIIFFVALFFYVQARKKYLAAKMTALKLLTLNLASYPAKGNNPSSALEILRQVTLFYFPREQIASLTGSRWYKFLDHFAPTKIFQTKQEIWQSILYQRDVIQASTNKHQDEIIRDKQLISDCILWVESALPPSKKKLIEYKKNNKNKL